MGLLCGTYLSYTRFEIAPATHEAMQGTQLLPALCLIICTFLSLEVALYHASTYPVFRQAILAPDNFLLCIEGFLPLIRFALNGKLPHSTGVASPSCIPPVLVFFHMGHSRPACRSSFRDGWVLYSCSGSIVFFNTSVS